MGSLITLGLAQILVGTASPEGTMPEASAMKKIGKTYQDTAKISQDSPDVTEHFEEGNAIPVVRKLTKKPPVLSFSIMDADIDTLVEYVGGTKIAKANGKPARWAFDGSESVANKAILVQTEQGLNFELPNASIEALINTDLSAKGIFLVEFKVTPLSVTNGKGMRAFDPNDK